MNINKFIGIFDSGVGGLNVLKNCIKIMPNENYLYYADSKNAPFGKKNISELKNITNNIIFQLKKYDLKEIIIACGTVSTNLYNYLSNKFNNVHFVGTYPDIEQVFKSNVTIAENAFFYGKNEENTFFLNSQNFSTLPPFFNKLSSKSSFFKYIFSRVKMNKTKLKVLFIATSATCNSQYIKNLIKNYNSIIDIYVEPADKIVYYVENNKTNSIDMENYLKKLFKQYENINSLILGCTHFPFITENIKKIINSNAVIIDGCKIAAENAKKFLIDNNMLSLNNNLQTNNSNSQNDNEELLFHLPIINILDTNLSDEKICYYKKLLDINENKYSLNFYKT